MDTKSSCSNDHDEPEDPRDHEVGPILKNVLCRGKLQVVQFNDILHILLTWRPWMELAWENSWVVFERDSWVCEKIGDFYLYGKV